jgi:hypothetical protein
MKYKPNRYIGYLVKCYVFYVSMWLKFFKKRTHSIARHFILIFLKKIIPSRDDTILKKHPKLKKSRRDDTIVR